MKIRRVRRGYTTNSSAYTEWLPPPQNGPAPGPGGQAAQGGGATQGARPGTPPPPAAGTTTTVPAPTVPSAAPPPSPATGNSLVLAGLALALAGVFVTERIVRRLRRRPPKTEDTDE